MTTQVKHTPLTEPTPEQHAIPPLPASAGSAMTLHQSGYPDVTYYPPSRRQEKESAFPGSEDDYAKCTLRNYRSPEHTLTVLQQAHAAIQDATINQ